MWGLASPYSYLKKRSCVLTYTSKFLSIRRNLVTTEIQFNKLLDLIKEEKYYTCDTEFKIVNEYDHKVDIRGVSFYLPDHNQAYYIPVNCSAVKEQLDWNIVRDGLQFMADRNAKLRSIWHLFKADYKCLLQHGVDVWDHYMCTYMGSLLLNENSHDHGLKSLALKKFDFDQIEYDALVAISRIQRSVEWRAVFKLEKTMTLRQAWETCCDTMVDEDDRYQRKVHKKKARIKELKEYGNEKDKDKIKKLGIDIKRIPKPPSTKLWKILTARKEIAKADIGDLPIRYVLPYATDDVIVTWELFKWETARLKKQELITHAVHYQTKLSKVLGRMELRGTIVDMKAVREEKKATEDLVAKLEARISRYIVTKLGKYYVTPKEYEKTGQVIKLSSPQQLARFFYEDLGLAIHKRTKGGKPSTDDQALSHHSQHKIVRLYLKWKKEQKILSTYLNMFIERAMKDKRGDYRIHPTFNQYGAATGRLSCKNPNLQNQPQGVRIRRFYTSKRKQSKHKWVKLVADYSQVELRILAYNSKDKQLTKAYTKKQKDGKYLDIHRFTAALVFKVPYDKVDEVKHRKKAKTINFGIIYGMAAMKLAEAINVSIREAQRIIDQYFESYYGVKVHFDEQEAYLMEHGYVKTYLGRRRRFPEIKIGRHRSNSGALARMIRQAINAAIQGTSMDITGGAMIQIEYKFYDNPNFEMDLTVHDELSALTRADKVQKYMPMFVRCMENPFGIKAGNPIAPIPLLAEAKYGNNWAEAKT